jgi:small subunit ribosomal protein S16
VGRKKQPSYRIVVTESAAPRDGAYIDTVGFYNPQRRPAELTLDLEKVEQWIARGAELTDTTASLVRKARKGGDASVTLVKAQAVEAEAEVEAEPAPKRGARARAAKEPAAAVEAEPVVEAAAAAEVAEVAEAEVAEVTEAEAEEPKAE